MKAGHNQVQFEVWKNPDVSHITFSSGQYTNFSFSPHFHEHYIIQVVDQGMNEGFCQGERFEAIPGDVLLINPGEIHTGNSFEGKPLKYMGICPEIDQIRNCLRSLEISDQAIPIFTTLQIRDKQLAMKIRSLIKVSKTSTDILLQDILRAEVFCQLFRKYSIVNLTDNSNHLKDKTKVKRAINYIRENFSKQFTLNELSRYCTIDPYYLIKIFKKNLGLTPFQYLRNYRIEIATRKLRQNIPISQTALEVGFFDQSHLHRNFKQVTGMTPFQYKRQFHTRMAV